MVALLFALLVLVVFIWLITTYITPNEPLVTIVRVIGLVIGLALLLRAFGLWDGGFAWGRVG